MNETAETRAKLAAAIRDLQAKGDTNSINQLVSAYKAKYQSQNNQVDLNPYNAVGNAAKSVADNASAPTPDYGGAITDAAMHPGNPLHFAKAVGVGLNGVLNSIKDIVGAFNSGGQQVNQGVSEISKGGTPIQGAESGLRVESGLASQAFAPLAPVFKPVGAGVKTIADTVSNVPAVQNFSMSDAGKNTARVAEDLSNAGNVAGAILGADQAVNAIKQIPATIDNLDKTANPFNKTGTQSTGGIDEQKVIDIYNKAIKPSTAGKNTGAQVDRYDTKVVDVLKNISKNKDNITLTDANGEVIKGQTPKTLAQLQDANEQMLSQSFAKYDALAKQAGKAGIEIDTNPILSELDTIASDKALNLTNPSAVAYAKSVKSLYENAGALDATIAQNAIKNYNSSLEAFYKNPSYDNASHVAIDAMVANKLRTALDEGVSGLTGEQYQSFKNDYAASKALQKDLTKAVLRNANKSVKGLVDLTDVFTGAGTIHALASLNPSMLAGSLFGKAIAELYKMRNSPDAGVANMFKEVNKGTVAPAMEVVGNQGTSPLSIAESHITEAQNLLNPAENGGITHSIGDILSHTKTNIVQSLANEGLAAQAALVSKIDTSALTSLEAFDSALRGILK